MDEWLFIFSIRRSGLALLRTLRCHGASSVTQREDTEAFSNSSSGGFNAMPSFTVKLQSDVTHHFALWEEGRSVPGPAGPATAGHC